MSEYDLRRWHCRLLGVTAEGRACAYLRTEKDCEYVYEVSINVLYGLTLVMHALAQSCMLFLRVTDGGITTTTVWGF